MKKMRVIVGCECSGVVRRAFRDLGHDAWSCDLKPSEDGSPYHYQRDLREVIGSGQYWDLLIAHPDCTYLTISAEWAYSDGPYHMKLKPGTLVGGARRNARRKAIEFVRFLLQCQIPRVCIENPVGVISRYIPDIKPQYIQPWQFGHNASKRTGLWLRCPCLPWKARTSYYRVWCARRANT